MADRIGVITKGELILVEEKAALMQKLGKRQLTLNLQRADGGAARGAARLAARRSPTRGTGSSTPSTPTPTRPASRRSCARWVSSGSGSRTSHTRQSSLEEIFVSLVQR